MKISKVFLYDEPSVPEIEINNLAKFIEETLDVQVEVRKNFFEHFKSDKNTAYELASSCIFNPHSSFERHQPTEEEINFEADSFTDSSVLNNIILYDGFEIQNILKKIIPEEELSSDYFHLIFTTRLTCTYDYEDYRYHGRAVICSNPSIISTTGIIEAPAKPRAYYISMYHSMTQGLNLDSLKEQFKGKFLEYHDKNLGKVVRGYALQTIFYYLTTEPFCDSKECILNNAHWQEDLIHAQIELGRLCDTHQKILEAIKKHE
ncbi:DUF6775 family putative metallopeptidase [Candidatus Nitrosotalea bavarica]|uniref:DUF6775 family putative metallopeptidase n=1 Tax=Candidatus Nitrosotalea bavarica TaxID=1903277 RepID=UPI0015AB833D|nr:DUF6775 family putative metallopeptidase [Candidatus Nitrosotalea bavarica]